MALNLDVGTSYTYTEQQLWAALGSPGVWSSLSWEITPASSNLPPGMTATGMQVTGTPTTAGAYNIRMTETTTDKWGDPGPRVPHDLAVTVIDPNAPEPDPEAPPVVEPEPEPNDELAESIVRFLGLPDSAQALALAKEHARVVTSFVHGYTRGRGFDAHDRPSVALADVIVSAAARYVVNPQQLTRQGLGNQSVGYASLEGFTLAEKAVLHRYRRRTA